MLKHFFFAFAICIAGIHTSNAQITSGLIHYEFSFSSKDPSKAQLAAIFKDATMDLYFAPEKSKAVMDMGIIQMTMISDNISGKALMLMGGMAGNIAVPFTVEEARKISEESDLDIKVTYHDETEDVAGYTCKKAVATDKNGNKSTFWYSEEFELVTEGQQYFNTEIPGATLKFEVEQDGVTIGAVASNITKVIPESSPEMFDTTVPEGYQEMTLEDVKSMGLR